MSNKIKTDDILRIISDLAGKSESGTVTTKDIAIECGMQYPELHLTAALVLMSAAKKEGLLGYAPSTMLWWLTDKGKERIRTYVSER